MGTTTTTAIIQKMNYMAYIGNTRLTLMSPRSKRRTGGRGGSEMRWLSDVDGKVRHPESPTNSGMSEIQSNGQFEPHLFDKKQQSQKTGHKI